MMFGTTGSRSDCFLPNILMNYLKPKQTNINMEESQEKIDRIKGARAIEVCINKNVYFYCICLLQLRFLLL